MLLVTSIWMHCHNTKVADGRTIVIVHSPSSCLNITAKCSTTTPQNNVIKENKELQSIHD